MRACKHSKAVEAYLDNTGKLILWCYSCGKDVNK